MKRSFKFLCTILILITLASCKKITDGLNINPNKPTDASIDLLLNGAEVACIVAYEGNNARLAGMFSRSFTGSDRQYVSINNYNTQAADYDEAWNLLYSQVIAPTFVIENKALAVNNKTMIGIAQVIRAQAFGLAADLWGDIPFSQVANPENFPQPKFDSQADVYAGVQSLLDNAITNLSANIGVSPGSKDIFFAGDNTKWIAAARTLRARFYLHTKDYPNAITQAILGITSASGNMMAKHGGTYLSDMNLYNSFCEQDRQGYLSSDGAVAPNYLNPSSSSYRGDAKTNETARFNYIYNNSGAGLNTTDTGFFGASSSFPLVSFEERNLILAEAYAKDNQANNALNALNTHRTYMNGGGYINPAYTSGGSLLYNNYALSDFDPGGIQNPNPTTLTQIEALLKEILEERYLTFIAQIEQFNDVRRTKNALNVPTTTSSATKLPQRFLYSQSEFNSNSNTPVIVSSDFFKETTINLTAY